MIYEEWELIKKVTALLQILVTSDDPLSRYYAQIELDKLKEENDATHP